jgi:NTE family protein
MPTGLVLSGGGAKGDFQVGAIRFLYDQGVQPDIIAGTSVGAINGAKLAEGEGDPDQGLRGLESLWNSLQFNSDMYQFEPWLAGIDERIRGFLTGTRDDPGIRPPRTDYSEWGDLGWFMAKISEASWVTTDGAAILSFLEALMAAKALYNLGPIIQKLNANFSLNRVQAWSQSGKRLRLAVVGLESGRLRHVTESGTILERDNTTPVLGGGGVQLAPECLLIANGITELIEDRQSLQEDLQFAAPGEKGAIAAQIRRLNAEITREESRLQTCIAQSPRVPPSPLQVRLQDAILASASIPGIFLPVDLGGETYVDGGVREVLPLQVAIDAGADTIYAIACSKEAPDPKPSFASSTLLEIVARALTDLAIGEVARDDARGFEAPGRTIRIIQPTVDLHDMTTIDPGLISIGMAYGYMRAADVWDEVPSTDRAWTMADEISLLRREIWRLECLANGQPVPTEPAAGVRPADPALEPEIQLRKDRLRGLLEERRQLSRPLPADADRWWQTLERHPWVVATRAAQFVGQTVPASMAPGSNHQVSVVMRNTGTLPWTAAEGYRLGSQNPQDNNVWGLSRVDVPATIARLAEATFAFTVTAPAAPGTYNFQWQMLQEGVEWFGDPSQNIAVTVEVPEPAECQTIRSDIASGREEITGLRAGLDGLDPRNPADRLEIREIRRQIGQIEQGIAALQQRAVELGCR